jgi:plasmid stability protein
MTDLLIREVPDDVLTAIDVRAKRLGLSRSEYLRRALAREAAISELAVTSEALQRFSDSVLEDVIWGWWAATGVGRDWARAGGS